jgi:hypothetical protein
MKNYRLILLLFFLNFKASSTEVENHKKNIIPEKKLKNNFFENLERFFNSENIQNLIKNFLENVKNLISRKGIEIKDNKIEEKENERKLQEEQAQEEQAIEASLKEQEKKEKEENKRKLQEEQDIKNAIELSNKEKAAQEAKRLLEDKKKIEQEAQAEQEKILLDYKARELKQFAIWKAAADAKEKLNNPNFITEEKKLEIVKKMSYLSYLHLSLLYKYIFETQILPILSDNILITNHVLNIILFTTKNNEIEKTFFGKENGKYFNKFHTFADSTEFMKGLKSSNFSTENQIDIVNILNNLKFEMPENFVKIVEEEEKKLIYVNSKTGTEMKIEEENQLNESDEDKFIKSFIDENQDEIFERQVSNQSVSVEDISNFMKKKNNKGSIDNDTVETITKKINKFLENSFKSVETKNDCLIYSISMEIEIILSRLKQMELQYQFNQLKSELFLLNIISNKILSNKNQNKDILTIKDFLNTVDMNNKKINDNNKYQYDLFETLVNLYRNFINNVDINSYNSTFKYTDSSNNNSSNKIEIHDFCAKFVKFFKTVDTNKTKFIILPKLLENNGLLFQTMNRYDKASEAINLFGVNKVFKDEEAHFDLICEESRLSDINKNYYLNFKKLERNKIL